MTLNKPLIISLVLMPVLLSAQGVSTGSSQLKIPISARSASMGEATVSDGGQFSSWLLNPANLCSKGPATIELTHLQWIQEIQSENVGAQMPIPFGTVGFSVSSISVPGIEVREAPGPATATFSARFASLQLGFATNVMSDLAVGVSGKYLYEKLYSDDATGAGFDIGILYRTPLHGLAVGISVTNAGSVEAFRNERSDLPTFVRGGISYAFAYDDFSFLSYAAIASNTQITENHSEASIEAIYRNLIVVRVGYETGFDSRAITTGFGVRYEFVHFDYAFVPFSLGFGDGHIFTLGFQF